MDIMTLIDIYIKINDIIANKWLVCEVHRCRHCRGGSYLGRCNDNRITATISEADKRCHHFLNKFS